MSAPTDNYRLARSVTIAASAAAVFPHIAAFPAWQAWSPWEGLDPDLRRTYSGAESGLGARYAWAGNKKAGAGTMEVVEAEEPARIVVDLRFEKPFPAQNLSTFTLSAVEGGTRVDWVMTGHRGLLMRIMAKVIPFDAQIAGDFERGLAQWKAVAEASA